MVRYLQNLIDDLRSISQTNCRRFSAHLPPHDLLKEIGLNRPPVSWVGQEQLAGAQSDARGPEIERQSEGNRKPDEPE